MLSEDVPDRPAPLFKDWQPADINSNPVASSNHGPRMDTLLPPLGPGREHEVFGEFGKDSRCNHSGRTGFQATSAGFSACLHCVPRPVNSELKLHGMGERED